MANTTNKLPRWAKILIVIILAILLVAIDRLFKGHFELSTLIAISGVIIFFILRAVSQPFSRGVQRVLNLIGEDKDSRRIRPPWHFLLVSSMVFILSLYILLGDPQVTVPPVLQFNIIIVSSALGGLVLAGAANQRISDSIHDELISVAQKLIVATILFIFSTALLFFSELTTTMGWFHDICFWLTAICFFPGVILFAIGIPDLVLALSHIRQRPNTKKSPRGAKPRHNKNRT